MIFHEVLVPVEGKISGFCQARGGLMGNIVVDIDINDPPAREAESPVTVLERISFPIEWKSVRPALCIFATEKTFAFLLLYTSQRIEVHLRNREIIYNRRKGGHMRISLKMQGRQSGEYFV